MQQNEIEVGGKYAMREKVSAGEPLIHIEVLEKTGRSGQVKVRRLSEPHAGLEEYVKTRQLLVPWSERQTFLNDERDEKRFYEGAATADQALAGAICTVMVSTGYNDASADDDCPWP